MGIDSDISYIPSDVTLSHPAIQLVASLSFLESSCISHLSLRAVVSCRFMFLTLFLGFVFLRLLFFPADSHSFPDLQFRILQVSYHGKAV